MTNTRHIETFNGFMKFAQNLSSMTLAIVKELPLLVFITQAHLIESSWWTCVHETQLVGVIDN